LSTALSDLGTVFSAFPIPVGGVESGGFLSIPLLSDLFGLLDGGGDDDQQKPYQDNYGRHQIYPYLGIAQGLTPAQNSDSPILMIQATRGNPGADPDLGLEGTALDAEIRRLSALARSLPNGKERQKLQRKIDELRAKKSKKAHGADKFQLDSLSSRGSTGSRERRRAS
jgi:hypothetical protein